MANEEIRVRYAPSPTGHLHIGNARTALFNYLFARHNKGKFIIRIEDTDTKRNIEGGEQSQLENLKWLGMDWDEGPDIGGDYGPYRQSERMSIYAPLIQQLIDEGKAYESFKTEDELEAEREKQRANSEMPHYVYEYAGLTDAQKAEKIADAKAQGLEPVIRFHVPENHTYKFKDLVKGQISFDSESVGGDFVIRKRDGMPTYNFAVVIDDHMMKISHVLRGDDHIANTPKQLMIYEAFGWTPPVFGHMTLIINTETGKKLSKRDESVLQFIEQYRELGYLPDAMFNFIALLGWSPVGTNEIFTRKELIKEFDEKRLSKSPASFDGKKLEWVNNQYVKKSDSELITDLSLYELIKAGKIPENPEPNQVEWARQLIALYKDQMSFAAQIVELSDIFFKEPDQLDETAMKELADDDALPVLDAFRAGISELPQFTSVQIMKVVKQVQHDTGVKGRKLYMPIRIATTRSMHGPQLGESVELLGLKKTLHHIDETLAQMKA
ncbi:glutamate--tRNA ligase [Lapidilactobacillus mulanensis]|uniref:Glutamate--tRNA ligase n=1 Tax=Lapidilactobacillus mulanensis TaxID=2485999 RepID=A0ABW4DSE7_9LACO|nr:glutamate--tRNA ligase [Lapidilactobacillus mulanensis]